MRLTVHRFLVQEAARIHAGVSRKSDHGFLIVATRGSLARATDGFRSPPFAERARSDLGVTIEVGIGMGRTAVEAEAHARAALVRAQSGGGMPGIAPGREGLGPVPAPRLPEAGARRGRGPRTPSPPARQLAPPGPNFLVAARSAGRRPPGTP